MKQHMRCRFSSVILWVAVSCSIVRADGPGLGNLTYSPSELFSTVAIFDENGSLGGIGGVHLGQGFVTMHRGYLIVPFSADGGGGNGSGGVAVYDVSDPRNVSKVFSSLDTAVFTEYNDQGSSNYIGDMREPHGYGVSGDTFCFSTNRGLGTGIEFWDFSDPAAGPDKLAKLVLPLSGGDYSPTTWWVFWQGGRYAYVAGTTAGLFIVDTADLNNLSYAQIPTSSLGGFRINTCFAVGNLLVVAMSDGDGITTADISDPMNPVVLQTLTSGQRAVGYSMMINGDKILGANDPARIWDISNPSSITLLGQGQNVADKGGYGTFQDGIFHYGSSSAYVKLDLTQTDINGNFVVLATNSPTGFNSPDWDFGTALGNLVFQGNDHQGSALVVKEINPDTTGPEVNMVSPRDNAVNQALTSRVGLTFTDQIDIRSIDSTTVIIRPLGGSALAGTYSHQTGIVNFCPASPLQPNTTYEVVVPAGGVQDYVGNFNTQTFTSVFSTGATISEFNVDIIPDPLSPILVGGTSFFDAVASGNDNTAQFSWDFGDGTPATSYSTTSTANHTYDEVGHYAVTVFARDGGAGNPVVSQGATLTVYNPIMAVPPTRSSTIIYDDQTPTASGDRVWVANADNDTISAMNTNTFAKITEIPVGDHPRTLAQAPNGKIWVANQDDDTISIVNNVTETIDSTVTLDYGSAPYGITFAPDVSAAYVTLVGKGQLLKLDPTTGAILDTLDVGPKPRGIAVRLGLHGDVDASGSLGAGDIGAVLAAVYNSSTDLRFDVNGDFNVNQLDVDALLVLLGVPLSDFNLDSVVNLADLAVLSENIGAADAGYEEGDNNGDGKVDMLDVVVLANQFLATGNGVPAEPTLSDHVKRILVTRFISPDENGEIFEVSDGGSGLSLVGTHTLAVDPGPDLEDSGRGVPNYISSLVISPDGAQAWIPSKKDNIERGVFRDGLALTFESTVRTIVSKLNLTDNTEDLAGRVDFNDSDMAFAAALSPLGDYVFVAQQGTNAVRVVDAYDSQDTAAVEQTGLAPQGVVLDPAGSKMFVQNFMSRSVHVYDISGLTSNQMLEMPSLGETAMVASETFSAEVLLGKQIFYNSADPRMSQDKYLSCASCHLDGGSDGRVWDFTNRNEGFRNTITMQGRRGTAEGHVHWSANFDEIQDFENDIRGGFGGQGFMTNPEFNAGTRSDPLGDPKAGVSAELDALAAFVTSLDSVGRSPFRNPNGTMTAAAVNGQQIFNQLKCFECHGGPDFTDSAAGLIHDVGTVKPSSGLARGFPIKGFDVPTLRGLWATGPYLHDGSAATLFDLLTPENGVPASMTQGEREDLVAYLLQIDDGNPAASEQLRVEVTSPADETLFTPGDNVAITAVTSTDITQVVFLTKNDFDDGIVIGTDTNPGDGWGVTWVNVPAGRHTVVARATHMTGAISTSAPIHLDDGATDPSLLLDWELDENSSTTAGDSSGNNHDGVLAGVAWSAPGYDGGGSSVLFMGSSGESITDDDAENFINGLNAITVSIWVKSDLIGTDRGFLLGSDPAGSDNVLGMRYDASGASGGGTNVIKVAVNATGGGQSQYESANNVQTTAWQHLALTWSSGSSISLYIDGVLDTPTVAGAVVTGTLTANTKLIVGRGAKDDTNGSWDGLVDSVKIYDRVLSPTEIADLAGL